MFTRSEAGIIRLSEHPEIIELRGDLRINNRLEFTQDRSLRIVTGKNILTISNGATTSLNASHFVVGNLVMTASNIAPVVYHIGNMEDNTYAPVTLRFASPGTAQEVLINLQNVDPTAGRGGNSNNSLNYS
jgi:hypothetical protein